MKLSPEEKYFLPYQRHWILDAAPLRICEKSRQIGMSYADSYQSVRLAAPRQARLDVWVMSRDEVQAKQYLLQCKRWAQVLRYAAEERDLVVLSGGHETTAHVLRFRNGHGIHCLSSHPDAIVGKSGHVKLDEFALHRDQRTLYAVAKPVTQWGGTLSLISTHRGAHTVFNEIIQAVRHQGNPMGWSLHRIAVQDAVEQGLVEKIDRATGGRLTQEWKEATAESEKRKAETLELETRNPEPGTLNSPFVPHTASLREWWLGKLRAECLDEESWLQEHCCVPADEAAAFITYDMITACEYGPGESWEISPSSPQPAASSLFIGVDVGRDHDLTVIWVCERVADTFFTRAVDCLQNQTFEAQEAALYAWLECPRLRRCCIDATGIGRQFCERAQRAFGSGRVERVHFTGPIKEELAYPVRAAFERRAVRIPAQPAIRSDLRAIRKETTIAGNIRFTADRGKNGHADRFWALALALQAGRPARPAGQIIVFDDSPLRRALAQRNEPG